MITVQFFLKSFVFPPTEEPVWKSECERWQFLDEASFACAQTIFELRLTPPPEIFYLCSPEGSNQTDLDFVIGNYMSPAKFVHTLPNVRVSSFFQVSKLKGEVLCFSNGVHSLAYGLNEALHRFAADTKPSVLVSLQKNTVLYAMVSNPPTPHDAFTAHRIEGGTMPTDSSVIGSLSEQSFSVLDWSLTRK